MSPLMVIFNTIWRIMVLAMLLQVTHAEVATRYLKLSIYNDTACQINVEEYTFYATLNSQCGCAINPMNAGVFDGGDCTSGFTCFGKVEKNEHAYMACFASYSCMDMFAEGIVMVNGTLNTCITGPATLRQSNTKEITYKLEIVKTINTSTYQKILIPSSVVTFILLCSIVLHFNERRKRKRNLGAYKELELR